ncbi:MAG: PAC2 family protein [Candidatus Brockarchaeota archaeon]|nr:PAC2 family protein [Candidatus Brockarchaeota archaeon]
MRGRFTIYEQPELREPLFILGFRGWADAGRISSGCVGYLVRKLGARRFGVMVPDDFYILQNSRPLGWIEEGIIRRIEWPSTELFYYKNSLGGNDLILLLADEPNFKPNEYAEEIVDLAISYKVRRIYVIGGVIAPEASSTWEQQVEAVVGDPGLKAELKKYGIRYVTYGSSRQLAPVGIHSLLVLACQRKGIDVVSLWGRAPPFANIYPKSIHAVLEKLVEMLKIDLDLEDIEKTSRDYERLMEEAARQQELSESRRQPEYFY